MTGTQCIYMVNIYSARPTVILTSAGIYHINIQFKISLLYGITLKNTKKHLCYLIKLAFCLAFLSEWTIPTLWNTTFIDIKYEIPFSSVEIIFGVISTLSMYYKELL